MDKERIFDSLLFYISRKDKITCKQYLSILYLKFAGLYFKLKRTS
jgi:hypothetical protein